MSSIDLNSGVGSSSTTGTSGVSGPTPSTSSGAPSGGGPVDSMSSSSSSLPSPLSAPSASNPLLSRPEPTSLLKYANAISDARVNLQTETAENQELGFLVTKDMWANAIGIAEMIRDYYNTVDDVHDIQNDVADSQALIIPPANTAIDSYNVANDFTADQAAIDQMNLAITNYNNGTITEADFNLAVSTYNIYAGTNNAQLYVIDYSLAADAYNAQVTLNNADIEASNINRIAVGLPPLPIAPLLPTGLLPTQSTSPTVLPPISAIPGMPGPVPNAVQQIFRESLSTVLQNSGFQQFAEDLKNSVDVINNKLAKAESFRDLNMFLHRDILDVRKPPYSSDSYIQEDDQGSTPGTSSEAAASGSCFAQLALGPSSNGLPRVLALNLFQATCKEAQTPLYLKDVLAMANISIGQTAGFLSAAPGVLALGDKGLAGLQGAGGPSVSVLVGLGITNVIRGLISSQALSGLIGNLLSANGVSDADIAKISRTVTAGFQLSLIQQAILQVASSVGLPGSVAQILGSLSGIPHIESILGSATNRNVNDALNSSYVSGALQANLITHSGNQSQLIKDALSSAIANGPYSSSYAFSDAYQAELESRGLDAASAQGSALQAGELLRSELSSENLDETVTNAQINAAAQNSDRVTQQAVNSSLNQQAIRTESQTVRDIRDGLLKELTIKGYVFDQALAMSDRLVSLISGNTLAQKFSAEAINQSALRHSLEASLSGNAALAAAVANGALSGGYGSSAQVREGIYSQLVAAGIEISEAHAAAENAWLVRNGDPFYRVGATGVLPLDEIGDRLQSEAYAILKQDFDNPTALGTAKQLREAVVGTPTNAAVLYDDLHRPASLFNQANDQIAVLVEKGDKEMMDAVTESFRETMRPTDDLFYIVNMQNTPGKELINAMSLMNAGHGKHPSNFMNSIDIPV